MGKFLCWIGRHRFKRWRAYFPCRVAFVYECTRCGHKELEVLS